MDNLMRNYMFKFSIESLKNYLGQDVINTLLEWTPSNQALLTRKHLIDMILSLHGVNILKDRQFRKDLLLSMEKKDIYEFRDSCLNAKEKEIQDPHKLIEIIINKSWSKNKVSIYFLGKINIDSIILEKEKDTTIQSDVDIFCEERFYELLDYQYLIKQRILDTLNSGTYLEKMLVHMPTGTGKTKTTMHTIVNYLTFTLMKKGIVIWVAHTNELLEQAYETFCSVWKHLGDGKIRIYRLWGNNEIEPSDEPLDGMVFCGLSKLMSIESANPDLFNRLILDCRLLVFDEAHKAAAFETKKIIEKFIIKKPEMENRSLIGLSATPGRTTEGSSENNRLSNLFGNKIIYIDTKIVDLMNQGQLKALNTDCDDNIIKYFQQRKILAKMHTEKLKYKMDFTETELEQINRDLKLAGLDDFTQKQLEIFAKNKDRNLSIVRRLRELYKANIPTIVFACSVNHAKMLSAMLSLEDITNSLVLGEMNSVDRRNAIKQFKDKSNPVNILINYQVLTTGFDATNIKCVFITRPTQSIVLYSQMLGRGLRGPLMGGNEECLLIDIEDNLKSYNNEAAFSHFDNYWRT